MKTTQISTARTLINTKTSANDNEKKGKKKRNILLLLLNNNTNKNTDTNTNRNNNRRNTDVIRIFNAMRGSKSSASTQALQREREAINKEIIKWERKDRADCERFGYPELIVFDLDACFWTKEMYQLQVVCTERDRIFCERTNTCIGVRSGERTVIELHEGARKALEEYLDGKYPGARLATASSADTPLAVSIGKSALSLLEIIPGVSCASVFAIGFEQEFAGNMQIGRTKPLSSNKSETHFPILRKETNVPYDKMLFFDDCNWEDHCAAVESRCVENGLGPCVKRTPKGLGIQEWESALAKYKARHEQYNK